MIALLFLCLLIFIQISYSDCIFKYSIPEDDPDWGYDVYECNISDLSSVYIQWGEDVLKISKTKRYNEFYIYINNESLIPSSIIIDEGEKYIYKNIMEIEHIKYYVDSRKSLIKLILEKRPRILLRYGIEKPSVYPGERFSVDLFLKNCGTLNARNLTVEISYDKILKLLNVEPGTFFPILSPDCKDITIRIIFEAGAVLNITETTISIKVLYNYINLINNVVQSNYKVIKIPVKILGGLDVKIYRDVNYPWDIKRKKQRNYAEPGEKIYITDIVEVHGTCKKGYILYIKNEYPSSLKVIGDSNFVGKIDKDEKVSLSYILTSDNEIELIHRTFVKIYDLCSGYNFTYLSKPIKIIFKRVTNITFYTIYTIDDVQIKSNKIKLEPNKTYEFKSSIKYLGNIPLRNVSIAFSIENSTNVLSKKSYTLNKIYPGEIISLTIYHSFKEYGEYFLKTKITYFDEYHKRYEKVEKRIKLYVGLIIRPIILYDIKYDYTINKYLLDVETFILNEGQLIGRDIWIRVEFPEEFLVRNYEGLVTIKEGKAIYYLDNLKPKDLKRIFKIEFIVPKKGLYTIYIYITSKDPYDNIYNYKYNYTINVKRYIIFKEAKITVNVYFEKTRKRYVEIPLGYKALLITEISNNGNETIRMNLKYDLSKFIKVESGKKNITLTLKPGEKVTLFHSLKPIYYGVYKNYLEIRSKDFLKKLPFIINVTGKSPKFIFKIHFKKSKNNSIVLIKGENATIEYFVKNIGDVFLDISLIIENETISFTLNPDESIIGEINVTAFKNKTIRTYLIVNNFDYTVEKNLNIIVMERNESIKKEVIKERKMPLKIQKERFNPFLIGLVLIIIVTILLIIRKIYY